MNAPTSSSISPSGAATSSSSLGWEDLAAQLRRSAIVVWSVVGAVLGGVAGLLLAKVIGLLLGAVVLAGVGALGAVTLTGRLVDSALARVVGAVDSREADVDDAPRLFNLMQGLCATAGVAAPRVSITNDPSINAMVAADPAGESRAEVIVTQGFIDRLERIEMEGALAVCLARLRSGLAEAQTLAAVVDVDAPWFVPGSVRRRIVAAASSGQALFDSDVKGVGITRYPPGLAAAIERMLDGSTRVSGALAHSNLLWLADPAGESPNDTRGAGDGPRVEASGVGSSGEERPSLAERLALLREI
jgi:heat shock protein HtpX